MKITGKEKAVRIAIDPELLAIRGPEIHWVWRLLLTTCGYLWEEVLFDQECDIAYTLDPNRVTAAKICIVADKRFWGTPAKFQIEGINYSDGLSVLMLDGVSKTTSVISTEVYPLLIQYDLIFQIYWFNTGQFEQFLAKKNHGFIHLNGHSRFPRQIFTAAPISQIISWFRDKINKICGVEPEKIWGATYTAAACAGHDVDYPEIVRLLEPIRILSRLGISGLIPSIKVLTGGYTHWHFQSWMEFEKSQRFRSAFYFVAQRGSIVKYLSGTPDPFYDVQSEKFRKLFTCLDKEGFEIGLQASYNAYQSREKFAAEKEKLEAAYGKPIFGNRHHYFHLSPDNLEDTLLIHEQINLKYDSSIFHNDYIGWRRGICHPYFPFHQGQRRELKTLQIPSAWMDDQLFGLKEYNPGDRKCLLRSLVDRVSETEGCLSVNIHEYVYEDDLFPDWARSYKDLWAYVLSRGNYWLATPLEIAEYWMNRYQNIVAESRGLRLGLP